MRELNFLNYFMFITFLGRNLQFNRSVRQATFFSFSFKLADQIVFERLRVKSSSLVQVTSRDLGYAYLSHQVL